jgi:hypothetical protein
VRGGARRAPIRAARGRRIGIPLRFSITSKDRNIDGPGPETRGDNARNKRQIGFALPPSFASSRLLALPTKTLNPATPPQFPHPLRPPCGHAARMPPMEFFWGNHFLPLLPHSIRSAVCSRRVGVFFRAFRSKFGCGSRHLCHQSWRFVYLHNLVDAGTRF